MGSISILHWWYLLSISSTQGEANCLFMHFFISIHLYTKKSYTILLALGFLTDVKLTKLPYMSLFSWYKFSCFIQKVNFVGNYSRGCYFSWLRICVHGFIDSAIIGYNKFYNQYREIWEASYKEKRKIFDPFVVSVMKDKEIASTYFNSAIITW